MDAPTFDAILTEIAAGTPGCTAYRTLGISDGSFFRYIDADSDAAERYARARAKGWDRLFDQTLAIADDPSIEPNDKRIRVDVRKWALAKAMPKKYGDSLALTGPDGGALMVAIKKTDADVL